MVNVYDKIDIGEFKIGNFVIVKTKSLIKIGNTKSNFPITKFTFMPNFSTIRYIVKINICASTTVVNTEV